MRDAVTASNTAILVALLRGYARFLPPTLVLAHDPYGIPLATSTGQNWVHWLVSLLEASPRVTQLLFSPRCFGSNAAYMQLRTRCIDDAVHAFVAQGGKQIVILGAGLDARALRLASVLSSVTLVEVDSPGSQRAKLAGLARGGKGTPPLPQSQHTRYVSFDFVADALSELPGKLRDAGVHPSQRTLTILEGVLVYLPTSAVDDTLRAINAYSGPGSQLVMTLQLRAPAAHNSRLRSAWATLRETLTLGRFVLRAVAAAAGERFQLYVPPGRVGAWLGERGYRVVWDKSLDEIGAELGVAAEMAPFARAQAGRRAAGAIAHIACASVGEVCELSGGSYEPTKNWPPL